MKALIILKSAGETGKTQTLKYLADKLCAKGKLISQNYHYNGADFAAMVEFRGHKLGIITIGDPGTEEFVFSELAKLYDAGCELAVVSSRSSGRVYGLLCQFGKEKGAATIETSPFRTYPSYCGQLSHKTINEMCAGALFGAINFFVDFDAPIQSV